MTHNSSPAGIHSVTDINRCDEYVIRTGATIRTHIGVMFIHTVIVCKNSGGSNIGLLSDGGVSDIGQVRYLRTGTDPNILGFAESPYLGVFTEDSTGTQIGEGTHLCAIANAGRQAVYAENFGAVANLHIDQS